MARMPRIGASPSTTGMPPRMQKMFDGRNMATRPIPIIVDASEARAIAAAAADQRPKGEVVNMPSKPRPTSSDTIFGVVVPRSSNLSHGVYDPSAGTDTTL